MKDINNKIEFKDFSESLPTVEFVAVLNFMNDTYLSFDDALKNRVKIAEKSLSNLYKLEKEKGRYSQDAIDARRVHKVLEEVTNKDISKEFSSFLMNYDGIIEFLIRFNLVGKIKKHDITPFINNKNNN